MSSEPGRTFECAVTADGGLRPMRPGRALSLKERHGEVVLVRLLEAAEIRRELANRYWWAACVGTVKVLWQAELEEKRRLAGLAGLPILIPKEAIHDRLVTIFGGGLIETPVGPARTSSATKSVKEFNAMTESVRDYVWHEYGCPIPSGEDWIRDHADDGEPAA